jgi:uncharacterized RDD family membrane protein YckC
MDLRSKGAEWNYAGWLRRVAAAMIDGAVLLGGLLVGLVLLGIFSTSSFGDALAALVMSAFLLSVCLYDPICHGVWQQTVGKRALGIALARDTGERASFSRALWRHFTKLALAAMPVLGLLDVLNPFVSKEKQTVHDAVASTIVIRVR